jgi:hypothetical protein
MSELTTNSHMMGQYGTMAPSNINALDGSSHRYSSLQSIEKGGAAQESLITDRGSNHNTSGDHNFNSAFNNDNDHDNDSCCNTDGFADSVVGRDLLDEPEAKYADRQQAFGGGTEDGENVGTTTRKDHRATSSKLQQSSTVSPGTTWSEYLQMFALNVVILSVTFLVATHVPDRVSLVWQVAGSLVVLPVTVCVPAVFYLLLGRKLHTESDSLTYIAYVMVIISVPLVVVCGFYNVAKLV